MVVDILIVNGTLITMDGEGCGIIENGALAIKGNRIIDVGEKDQLLHQYSANRYIDAADKAVLPGFIDCHMHSSDGIARGFSQDIDEWLYKGIWPIIRHADSTALNLGSKVCIMEAVKSGTTTFFDDVNNILDIIDNHVEIGTRAIVSDMINEVPFGVGEADPQDLIEFDRASGELKFNNNVKAVEKYHGLDENRIRCMMGPQAPEMLSTELLMECVDYANRKGVGIHMHVAQSRNETIQMKNRYGKTSVQYLDDLDILNKDFHAAHLLETTENEMRTLIKKGCSMALCPNSIAVIDGIVPPAAKYLNLGGKVGIGTDQAPGNNRNSLFNEMKMASVLEKYISRDPKAFPCYQMLKMVTIDAAKAMGIEDEVGSLTAGKKADVILIDLLTPSMQPVLTFPIRNIIPNLVYSAKGNEVDTVIIDGKVVVENKTIMTVNEKKIIEEANESAREFCQKINDYEYEKKPPLMIWTEEGYY